MARKVKKKKVAARKKVAKKMTVKKKVAKKKVKKIASPQKGAATKKTPAKTKRKTKKKARLGRPKVSSDEKLYLMFKEDYHARQIFVFLRVETVRQLEAYSPKQIIKLLTTPLVGTVDQIRKRLADANRHLTDDEEFALDHLANR